MNNLLKSILVLLLYRVNFGPKEYNCHLTYKIKFEFNPRRFNVALGIILGNYIFVQPN